MPDSKSRYAALKLIVAGLIAGLFVGLFARVLTSLEPTLRLLALCGILLYGIAAAFISSFFKAEREHELRVAAYFTADREWPDPASSRAPGRALRLVK